MKAMDDSFLYQLHEEPDPKFAKDLRQTLTQVVPSPKWRLKMNFPILTVVRKTKWVWIVSGATLGLLLFATTSPARALMSSLIEIAGQSFTMTDDYPGDNDPGETTIIEPQVLSLADALAAFPHEVSLPTYVPFGYLLEEENIRVYVGENAGPFADTVELTWSNSGGYTFLLRITNHDNEIVGPDSVEEIALDADHPAAVIRGGWDVGAKTWTDGYGRVRLKWLVGELTYDLSGGTDVEQLKHIALSTLK
jgi:hypothetical protein